MKGTLQARYAQHEADQFNREHPVGVPCEFWPAERSGAGKLSRTRSEAMVFGGHTAVVLIENHTGIVALSHVEVVKQ